MASGMAGGVPRLQVVRDFDALDAHAEAWDRLALDAPQRLPMLSHAWTDAFLRHRLPAGSGWLCALAYDGDALAGVLPAVVAPHPLLGRRAPVLRTPYDNHTPAGDVLVAPSRAGLIPMLLDALCREVPHHVELRVRGVRQGAPLLDLVGTGTPGHSVRSTPGFKGSRIPLDGTLESYLATLGTGTRRNLRRYRKRFQERATLETRRIAGGTEAESFLAEFLHLEAAGWKGREGTAIANSPSAVAFYTGLVRNFARQGRVQWHVLTADGRVVAAALGIRFGASLMIPKIAYDETHADCSPGLLLMEDVVAQAFAAGDLDEVNTASDAPWHRQWRMPQDDYAEVRLLRKSPTAVLLHAPLLWGHSGLRRYVRPHMPSALMEAYVKARLNRNERAIAHRPETG